MVVKPGDVYTVWDMYGERWIMWLFLRPCTDADLVNTDTWGYPAKNEFGQYWHYVDLETGEPQVTIDNVLDNDRWELL